MPAIIGVLWGGFYSIIGSLVGRVLLALGLGVVEFAGFQYLFSKIKNMVVGYFTQAGPEIMGVLYAAQVDVCLSITFSAILIKMTLQGLNSANGTFKKMGMK